MKSRSQIIEILNRKMNLLLGALFISFAILAGACSSDADLVVPTAVQTVVPTEVAEDPLQNLADLIDDVQEVQRELLPVIFNVQLTTEGPQPEHLFVPSSRDVQIVLRNRSAVEMHYEVLDLIPVGMKWISIPEEAVEREVGVSDDDHEAHHERDFVEWRAESPSGIQPSGEEVHGYVTAGEIDVIRFSSEALGTFDVIDPLHPEFSARLTVY